jgi:hypothetical protein
MSTGFQVFYDGLVTASTSFAQQATTYDAIMPNSGFGCPRGGDDEIDRIMNLLVVGLSGVHNVIANVMETHAWKLREAHDNYNRSDSDAVAGILAVAYEAGYPLQDKTVGTGNGSTFVPFPVQGKALAPNPISVTDTMLDSPPQWNALKYGYLETLGLGYTGPPTDDPWIGGDFKGMWDLAEKLRRFAMQTGHGVPSGQSISFDAGTVIDNLNRSVRTLLTQSGEDWHGTAAENFSRSYSKDAAYATVVSNAAWDSADAISNLVWQLYGYQTELEQFAQPIADHGYRISFDAGDSDHFAPAATASAQAGWDWHPTRDQLKDLYDTLAKQAHDNRAAAARTLNQQYEILVGILQHYQDDNDGRVHTPDLNDTQNDALKNSTNDLNALQNSGDTRKAASSLHLDWVAGGKAALQQAATHGRWKEVAGPIATIILTIVSVA